MVEEIVRGNSITNVLNSVSRLQEYDIRLLGINEHQHVTPI
jgi:hypothetical protein